MSWAEKYSIETLELALAAAYIQRRDPAHVFDVAWHDALAERIQQIQAELAAREATA